MSGAGSRASGAAGWPERELANPLRVAVPPLLFGFRLWAGRETDTFLLTIAVFLLGFVGLIVSLWPYVIPRHVTIWDGISDPQTLAFIGVGLVIILPIVLAYQGHAYWVFRGKTRDESGYGGGAPQPDIGPGSGPGGGLKGN